MGATALALAGAGACAPAGATTQTEPGTAVRANAPTSDTTHPAGRTAVRASEPAADHAVADPALELLNPLLEERIASLADRSPTWRAALDTLRATGFRIVLGDPDDVRGEIAGLERYQAKHFGEVVPLRDGTGRLVGAAVVVDVERVRRLVTRSGLPERVLRADIDRILIHEVYGHAVPLAQARRLEGGCPDPAPGAPPSSSCAIRRENRVRAELGLELRTAYDLTGLAVGRYLRGLGDAP